MCIRDSAYTYVEKAPDDLNPRTKENLTLEELMKTWMAKMEDNCLFISCLLYTSILLCQSFRFDKNHLLGTHDTPVIVIIGASYTTFHSELHIGILDVYKRQDDMLVLRIV